MTLDEAIALLEKMAKENEEKASLLRESENVSRTYWEYAARFRVIACWLIELKMYRKMILTDCVDGALHIIGKYQKIKQIYDNWNEVNDFSYNQAMQKIGEVLEDGNDKRRIKGTLREAN